MSVIQANNYKNAKETCKRLMISRFHAGHPLMNNKMNNSNKINKRNRKNAIKKMNEINKMNKMN